MTATTTARRAGAPWHYWVVGVLSLICNSLAAYDYLMTKAGGDAWLRDIGMSEAQIAYVHGYPLWMNAAWAIWAWSAVLGSILLLARSRYAFHVFVASLATFLVNLVYAYLLTDGGKLMGQQGIVMNLVILAGGIFFAWYVRVMTKRGLLR